MGWYSGFAPYVSVAERKRKAAKEVEKLKKKRQGCQPIIIEGRTIANTFWGKAWCKNLESYSDYSNRLPRGRSYVRNGSVIDLKVTTGEIIAKVCGSSTYTVKITINKVIKSKWNTIVKECAGKIDSVIELLQGKFSKAVMQIITDPQKGLFPHPKEIKLNCSCPDWADMCKHVAAVLYGIGARLDDKPEELFLLRQADHVELISKAIATTLTQSTLDQSDHILDNNDLSSLFGIDVSETASVDVTPSVRNKNLRKKKPNDKVSPFQTRQIKKTDASKKSKSAPKKNIKNVASKKLRRFIKK
jgi:uncharacterized Zn finger protein